MFSFEDFENHDEVELTQDIQLPTSKLILKKGATGFFINDPFEGPCIHFEPNLFYYIKDQTIVRKKNTMTDKFNSTDDRRIQNNPELAGYTGPDDVALSYRKLSDDDIALMKTFKLDCQKLINKIRNDLGEHLELELAIRHIIDGSANITRYITRFK